MLKQLWSERLHHGKEGKVHRGTGGTPLARQECVEGSKCGSTLEKVLGGGNKLVGPDHCRDIPGSGSTHYLFKGGTQHIPKLMVHEASQDPCIRSPLHCPFSLTHLIWAWKPMKCTVTPFTSHDQNRHRKIVTPSHSLYNW